MALGGRGRRLLRVDRREADRGELTGGGDFRDVHAVCIAGLATLADCWAWWREREQRSGRDASEERARLAIATHLARIVQHRPLDAIPDPTARQSAADLRRWYEEELRVSEWIDPTLYPDREPPTELVDLGERVDFLVRLCGAWDFGVLPELETVAEVRRGGWREAVDATRLVTPPTYMLLRRWHRLPPLPYLGAVLPSIRDDPSLGYV